MGPLMYKQRPVYPALIGAVVVLALGAACVCHMLKRVDSGEAEASSAMLAGCLTCGIAGSLVVAAFARYQFTHLWKTPDPAFTRKQKGSRGRNHQRSIGSKRG